MKISVISDFRLTSDLAPPGDKNLEYEINTKKNLLTYAIRQIGYLGSQRLQRFFDSSKGPPTYKSMTFRPHIMCGQSEV